MIPIGVGYLSFHQFKPTAVTPDSLVYWSSGKLHDSIGRHQSPYFASTHLSALALIDSTSSLDPEFIIPSDLFFKNISDTLHSIAIETSDTDVWWNVVMDSEFQLDFSSEGHKVIDLRITTSSGTYYANFDLEVRVSNSSPPPSGDLPPVTVTAEKSYDGGTASATMYFFLGCGHTSIVNPFIIVQPIQIPAPGAISFDHTTARYITNQMANRYWDHLINRGYDIVFVEYQNPQDYIQRNAFALESAITWVNQHKAGNAKDIVLGISMGGLVARYALRDMEINSIDHEVKTYISFDSPHEGAYFPIPIMQFLRFYKKYAGDYLNDPVIDALLNVLDGHAARQQLIFWTGSDLSTSGPHSDRTTLMSELDQMGFPRSCRNVAVCNGSLTGASQGYVGSSECYQFNYDGDTHVTIFNIRVSITLRNDLWAMPPLNQYAEISHFILDPPSPNIVNGLDYAEFESWFPGPTQPTIPSMDPTPGGYLSTWQQLVDNTPGANGTDVIPGWATDDRTVSDFDHPTHSFVPTYSSLAIANGEQYADQNISTLLANNTLSTPFDRYYGTSYNTPHALSDFVPSSAVSDFDDMISSLLDNETPKDLYLQNKNIASNEDFYGLNSVVAGANVTSYFPSGLVTVEPGVTANFQSGGTIRLEDGFVAEGGSFAHFFVTPTNCVDITRRSNSNPNTKITTNAFPLPTAQLSVYPNPVFADRASATFTVPASGSYRLNIYSVTGEKVATLTDQDEKSPRTGRLSFDVSNLISGTYFVALEYNGGTSTCKMVILK